MDAYTLPLFSSPSLLYICFHTLPMEWEWVGRAILFYGEGTISHSPADYLGLEKEKEGEGTCPLPPSWGGEAFFCLFSSLLSTPTKCLPTHLQGGVEQGGCLHSNLHACLPSFFLLFSHTHLSLTTYTPSLLTISISSSSSFL